MTDKLPTGWVVTKLSDVCLPVESTYPEDSPHAEFTYIDIGCINSESNRIAETKQVTGWNAPSRARQAVRKDDILFSTVRTYLRKIARVDRDYPNPVASTGFTVVRAAEGVSSLFLFYQMLTEAFLQPLHELQTGTSYPSVRDRDVLSQRILLPPTREQERIVSRLNAAWSRLDRASTAMRRAQIRLKCYRTEVLQAAISGELIHEWRKENTTEETGMQLLKRLLIERRKKWEAAELARMYNVGKNPDRLRQVSDKWKARYPEPQPPDVTGLPRLPKGWTWATPDQLSTAHDYSLTIGPFGSNLRVSDYRDSGVSLVFVRNIRSRSFGGKGTVFVSREKASELRAHQVVGGDVLITKMGDPPGDASLYPANAPTAVITADCIKFRPSPLMPNSRFFVHAINSQVVKSQILSATKGVAQMKVSLARFRVIAIPLPPLAEQDAITEAVEKRFRGADRLARTFDCQLIRTHDQRQALLCDAFAGKLARQDPNDEPAAMLLKRIRRARDAEGRNVKERSMRRKASRKEGIIRRPLLAVLRENGGGMKPEELFRVAGFDQTFREKDFDQTLVDEFYAELRALTGARKAAAVEVRNRDVVLLRARK